MTDLATLIRDVRFSSVRLQDAYDMGEVDYLLDRLLAAAEAGEPLAPILDGTEISQVRLREGYDLEEVDAFLERLRELPAPSGPPTPVLPPAPESGLVPRPDLAKRIGNARFTPVRIREGYAMGDVDQFLDRIEDAVATGQDVKPLVTGARFTPVRLREGYDMGEVDEFLEKIVADQRGPAPEPSVNSENPGLFERLFRKRR